MEVTNLKQALDGVDDGTFVELAPWNDGSVGGVRMDAGESPVWELHRTTDEVFHLLEGHGYVKVRTTEGVVEVDLPAGSTFVIPRGHWHKTGLRDRSVLWYATPGPSDHSADEDPGPPDRS